MSNDYFRKFITLSEDNASRGKSFGTLVAERRQGINKITLSVSNVKPKIKYSLEFGKIDKIESKFIEIGVFTSDEFGNGSLKKELENENLELISLENFDVCIVKICNSNELITPLVGYFSERKRWKDYYKNPNRAKNTNNSKPIEKPVNTNQYEFGFNKNNNEKSVKSFEHKVNNDEIVITHTTEIVDMPKLKGPEIISLRDEPVKNDYMSGEAVLGINDSIIDIPKKHNIQETMKSHINNMSNENNDRNFIQIISSKHHNDNHDHHSHSSYTSQVPSTSTYSHDHNNHNDNHDNNHDHHSHSSYTSQVPSTSTYSHDHNNHNDNHDNNHDHHSHSSYTSQTPSTSTYSHDHNNHDDNHDNNHDHHSHSSYTSQVPSTSTYSHDHNNHDDNHDNNHDHHSHSSYTSQVPSTSTYSHDHNNHNDNHDSNQSADFGNPIIPPVQEEHQSLNSAHKLYPDNLTLKSLKAKMPTLNSIEEKIATKSESLKQEKNIDMVEKLKMELENLRNLAHDNYNIDKKSAYENLNMLPYSINGVFDKSPKVMPFENKGRDIEWVSIDFSDLIYIETEERFSRNSFFRSSYKKFSHFILGKCVEESKTIYLVGVPDFFNHECEEDIRKLGFISFRESKAGIHDGYWLIVV